MNNDFSFIPLQRSKIVFMKLFCESGWSSVRVRAIVNDHVVTRRDT